MRDLARHWTRVLALLVAVLSLGVPALMPSGAYGAVVSSVPPGPRTAEPQPGASSLESAAARAGNTGRAVAMSLIGLAFAVAGTVLAFRRDFKEAAAVFAVGIIAVLLASAAGVSLLRDTVASLFGSR
jgi:hypothetical protein